MLQTGLPFPPALSGQRQTFETPQGALSFYGAAPGHPAAAVSKIPLLLIHSVNAAGSAYEVKPLFEYYAALRPVYALELPGFGFSERSDRIYSVRLMTDAVHAMTAKIRELHDGAKIDALALSLSCEFLARAISEQRANYRSAALVSATGMDKRAPYREPQGTTRAMPTFYSILRFPLWDRGFFKLLTVKRSIRYFLEKTWGSKNIDEGLLDYDYLTTHQPNARFAPYYFVSGYLFSRDITNVYEELTLPIWLAHGSRGDFQDYSFAPQFAARPNWTVAKFETGALPFFEMPTDFVRRYDEFLSRSIPAG
jgi:pimeloyl-ACP methyl ester carboxylesterase